MSISDSLQRADRFLADNRISPASVDFDAAVEAFLLEMERGLQHGEGSLAMIPTYIAAEGQVPPDTPVLVLDAGGTNFRVAAVRFDQEGVPQIEGFRKNPMPGSQGRQVGREEFFDLLSADIGDLHSVSDAVGFCFSYPTQIMPDHDGRVLHFSKEVKAPQVEGEYVGRGLREALLRAGIRDEKRIVVLNDTVATLLAAKSSVPASAYSTYIGFILGTGLNCAYSEPNERIGTIAEEHRIPGSQVINMESGGLDVLDTGPVDDEFDRTTNSPGVYPLEKMVSGAYLGPLSGTLLKVAAREGLFEPATAAHISALDQPDTVAMDRFLRSPLGSDNPIAAACTTDGDRAAAYRLIDTLVERAGKLAAINMSAAVLRTGAGTDPSIPAAICVDGTTFYRTRRLRFYTRYYLKRHLEDERGRFIRVIHRDNAPLVGAAVAGLLNS